MNVFKRLIPDVIAIIFFAIISLVIKMEVLADKLRPKNIDDIIGQKHLVGDNGPIRNFINSRLYKRREYGKSIKIRS